MTVADALALARAVTVVPIWYALASDQRALAFGFFVVAALTDVADGWLARRAPPTAHGSLVDPLADKVLVVGTAFALMLAGLEHETIPPALVACILVRELTVGIIRFARYRAGTSPSADVAGKAKTAAQMCALAVLLVWRPPHPVGIAALGVLWVAAIFGLVSLSSFWPQRRRGAL